MIVNRKLPLDKASDAKHNQARNSSLTFTTQKNGVENEVICHFLSGNPYICAVKAIKLQVCHLWSHNAPLSTLLSCVYTGTGSRIQLVTPDLITKTPWTAVQILGTDLVFLALEVSARSLRSAGAMALLVAKVDTNIIQILGWWRSDEMFWYLHLTSEPIIEQFSAKMINANYTLAPSQLVPCH